MSLLCLKTPSLFSNVYPLLLPTEIQTRHRDGFTGKQTRLRLSRGKIRPLKEPPPKVSAKAILLKEDVVKVRLKVQWQHSLYYLL